MQSTVFLDIDGVINSTENIRTQRSNGKPTTAGDIEIPTEMLLRIKRILEETKSILVISSTWRKFKNHMYNLERQFAKVGVSINGITDNTGKDRGYEILAYLRNNKLMGCPYIVLDDDSFDIKNYIPSENFILTSGFIGLTDDQTDAAINSLNYQKSILLGSITNADAKVYTTKDEAATAYSVYINTHINTVRFVFQRFIYLIIDYMWYKYPDEKDEWDKAFQFLKIHITEHDKSKFSEEEFEPYRIRFYKSNEDIDGCDEEVFNKAWEHHYTHNSHHPEFWVSNINANDVSKRKFIEMNKSSLLEMICDWLAMSYQRKQSLYKWWFNTDNGRSEKKGLLPSNTIRLLDDFITFNKETFDFSSNNNL